jgi:hypothetical protein
MTMRRALRDLAPAGVIDLRYELPLRWASLRWRMAKDRDALTAEADRRLVGKGDFWLFVLGLNNSGTTLLCRVLQSHPAVRYLHREGQFLTRALPLARDHEAARLWATRPDVFRWGENHDPSPAARARFDWSHFYPRRPGILLEKSPPNTMRSLWLQKNFTPSRFIGIVRSPYAVAEGIRRREDCSIEEAATHWARAYEALLEDRDSLEHFLMVRYEDLCERPDEVLRSMETFLELPRPFDRDVVERPQRVSNMEGEDKPISNFNAKSIERLSAEDIETIGRIASPLMAGFGYERL